MTITELHNDPQKMLAWLQQDGHIPTVQVETQASRYRSLYCSKEYEEKPVTDAETLKIWWEQYRDQLAQDYAKINPHRPKSWQNFLAQIASEMGFKKGKMKDKIAAARAFVIQSCCQTPILA